MWKSSPLDQHFLEDDHNQDSLKRCGSVSRITGLGYLFSSPKTKNSMRQVPIPDFLIDELLAHKKTQVQWKKRSGEQFQKLGLVISTEN